jgi:hypothetical protein
MRERFVNVKNVDTDSKDEQRLVEDARNALLAHYSAKSTSQTAILVGLAVALFADVQAYIALDISFRWEWERIAFLTVSVGLTTFFILRAISRLIYYGELASAITVVKMYEAEFTRKRLDSQRPELNPQKPYPPELQVFPTYLARLECSASDYFHGRINEKKTAWSAFSIAFRFIHNKWFKVVYLIVVIVVFIHLLVFA